MTAFDIIYCLYAIRQFMYDVWYIILTYRVNCYKKKDRPTSKQDSGLILQVKPTNL